MHRRKAGGRGEKSICEKFNCVSGSASYPDTKKKKLCHLAAGKFRTRKKKANFNFNSILLL